MRLPLLVVALLAAAALASGQQSPAPGFNPALIVPNTTKDCPVPVVKFSPDELAENDVITTFAPVVSAGDGQAPGGMSQACMAQVINLSQCLFDGSLLVKSGCCSTECAALMKQLEAANCIRRILQLMCTIDPDGAARVAPAISGAAVRCVGFPAPGAVVCSGGRRVQIGGPGPDLVAPGAGPANGNATAPAGSAHATAPAAGGGLNATGLAGNATAAPAASGGGAAPAGGATVPGAAPGAAPVAPAAP